MSWFRRNKKPEIVKLVDNLPESGLTVRSLKALDFIAPGEWKNITDFDELLREVTGEEDEAFLEIVKERAVTLYDDKKEGYRSAMRLYRMVDNSDRMLGVTALADKMSQRFSMLSFLDKLTPKADTAQTIDLALKVGVELLAFTKLNGLPGDSFGDFVRALGQYGSDEKIRMAALVCFDGLIPLGPDFVGKVHHAVENMSVGQLTANETFAELSDDIPGESAENKLGFIQQGFSATENWMTTFVSQNQLTVTNVLDNLGGYIEFADDKLDYLAAFLDVSTNYYEHTGTQTLATRVIERAVHEV